MIGGFVLSSKLAVTERFASMLTVSGFSAPDRSPLQSTNTLFGSATAVNSTTSSQ